MQRRIIIAILLLAIPALAQEGCGDLNCNGLCYEIGDLVLGLIVISDRCPSDYIQQCTVDNGDVDGDGIPLTMGDAMKMLYIINATDPPDFSRHPESDTIIVPSASAAPGETLELQLLFNTVDTLTAFQFAVQTDTDYITIDSVAVAENLWSACSYCDGYIYGFGSTEEIWEGDSIAFLPGEHLVAHIVVTINPDIAEPVTTYLEFLNDPENIRNTGFSNIPFFIPVAVAGEIQITPTGIDNGESGVIPRNISVEIYPNPFNGNASITVRSDSPTDLVIYDIAGRVVRRFPVVEGLNRFGWDASDDNGARLGSGVYFARLNNAPARYSKKIVFLK